MIAADVIWILVVLSYNGQGDTTAARDVIQHYILEYAELLIFLLAAMTYVNIQKNGFFCCATHRPRFKRLLAKSFYLDYRVIIVLHLSIADNLTNDPETFA
jgi:hypothetical protein